MERERGSERLKFKMSLSKVPDPQWSKDLFIPMVYSKRPYCHKRMISPYKTSSASFLLTRNRKWEREEECCTEVVDDTMLVNKEGSWFLNMTAVMMYYKAVNEITWNSRDHCVVRYMEELMNEKGTTTFIVPKLVSVLLSKIKNAKKIITEAIQKHLDGSRQHREDVAFVAENIKFCARSKYDYSVKGMLKGYIWLIITQGEEDAVRESFNNCIAIHDLSKFSPEQILPYASHMFTGDAFKDYKRDIKKLFLVALDDHYSRERHHPMMPDDKNTDKEEFAKRPMLDGYELIESVVDRLAMVKRYSPKSTPLETSIAHLFVNLEEKFIEQYEKEDGDIVREMQRDFRLMLENTGSGEHILLSNFAELFNSKSQMSERIIDYQSWIRKTWKERMVYSRTINMVAVVKKIRRLGGVGNMLDRKNVEQMVFFMQNIVKEMESPFIDRHDHVGSSHEQVLRESYLICNILREIQLRREKLIEQADKIRFRTSEPGALNLTNVYVKMDSDEQRELSKLIEKHQLEQMLPSEIWKSLELKVYVANISQRNAWLRYFSGMETKEWEKMGFCIMYNNLLTHDKMLYDQHCTENIQRALQAHKLTEPTTFPQFIYSLLVLASETVMARGETETDKHVTFVNNICVDSGKLMQSSFLYGRISHWSKELIQMVYAYLSIIDNTYQKKGSNTLREVSANYCSEVIDDKCHAFIDARAVVMVVQKARSSHVEETEVKARKQSEWQDAFFARRDVLLQEEAKG